jgi:hypothetical protein
MRQMTGLRLRATSLMLMMLATVIFGVCVAVFPAGGKLPCCPDLLPGESALTPCCGTGEQPAAAARATVQLRAPAASVFAFETMPRASQALSPRDAHRDFRTRPGDRQALLSIFLI